MKNNKPELGMNIKASGPGMCAGSEGKGAPCTHPEDLSSTCRIHVKVEEPKKPPYNAVLWPLDPSSDMYVSLLNFIYTHTQLYIKAKASASITIYAGNKTCHIKTILRVNIFEELFHYNSDLLMLGI